MSCINNDHIHLGFYQCIYTVQNVSCYTYTGTAQQSSLLVFGRIWIFDLFFNILDGDQSAEISIFIYNRKFFFSGSGKDLLCLVQCNSLRCCDQSFACHTLFDLFAKICFKLQVTVCDDTYQFFPFCDRYT